MEAHHLHRRLWHRTLRLVGNPKQQIAAFPLEQIKRVRIVHRADGYYCQFGVKARASIRAPAYETGSVVGIDMGLKVFYTDSDGKAIDNPRHYRKAETEAQTSAPASLTQTEEVQNRKKARQATGESAI